MTWTIWHNPRCGKSRQTLALLREHGIEPEVVLYLKTPPTTEQIEDALERLSLEPRQLMRRKEGPFKELDLKNERHSRADLIQAMVSHPILIERPIVFGNAQAALGRPPENVLGIMDTRA